MKKYLGDSVYAQYDGESLVLTTENGYPDDPRNKIVLEPDVLRALMIAIGKTCPAHNPMREAVMRLRTEVNCRIEHGANSGGHLHYVQDELDTILGMTS